MVTSNELDKLYTALVKAQKEMPYMIDFRSFREGWDYLKLEDMIYTTRPILLENGLIVTFSDETATDNITSILTCELAHVSGQFKRVSKAYSIDDKELANKNAENKEYGSQKTRLAKKMYTDIIGLLSSPKDLRIEVMSMSKIQLQRNTEEEKQAQIDKFFSKDEEEEEVE